jgi:hypothetical protein
MLKPLSENFLKFYSKVATYGKALVNIVNNPRNKL